MSFQCTMCGECCRNLKQSEIYAELDDGTGTCKYLVGNKCSIYDNRPLICRIDESYDVFFKELMTKNEYYEFSYKTCEYLKQGGE